MVYPFVCWLFLVFGGNGLGNGDDLDISRPDDRFCIYVMIDTNLSI